MTGKEAEHEMYMKGGIKKVSDRKDRERIKVVPAIRFNLSASSEDLRYYQGYKETIKQKEQCAYIQD